MKRSKENKAITLIALIITIIVLLILAMVTISAVKGDKIITYAKKARDDYRDEQNNENIFLANYIVKLKETAGLSESNEENTEVSDELVDYILGTKHEGRTITDIVNLSTYTFKNISESSIDANKITLIKKADGQPLIFYGDTGYSNDKSEIEEAILYFTYEEIMYKFAIKMNQGIPYSTCPLGTNSTIVAINTINSSSNVGKYVSWDSDGDNANELWIVLYDDSTNGLQIISANTMKYNGSSLSLGNADTYLTAKGTLQGSTDLEKSIYSYNNAITTLNSACNEIITNRKNVIDVRCVGSNPTVKNSEGNIYYSKYESVGASVKNGRYESNQLESWLNKAYNGIGKPSDFNALTDYTRMVKLGITQSNNGTIYWLASRVVYEYSGNVYFRVRCVRTFNDSSYCTIWNVNQSNASGTCESCQLRPVVKLSSGFTSGNGTIANPYTF